MDTGSIRRSSRAVALIALVALSAQAGIEHDLDRPVFVYALHPDVPMSRFASGAIGISEPAHARVYLFAAYRYFEGRPLTRAEQQMWLQVWNSRAHYSWPEGKIAESWTKVRKQVPVPYQAPGAGRMAVMSPRFVFTDICARDPYETAARTLSDRIRRFGAASAEVKFWTAGQDAVFRACETSVPQQLSPAPVGMHPLIRADREYQMAAALFYAQHFDEALAAFRHIAQDPASPWRVWAPYLVGRTLLWKARQTQSEPLHKQALAEAEAQFRSVLGDPKLRPTHAAAEYLMLRCMMITNRKAALERIGRRLVRGNWRETDLTLYLNGMDWLEGNSWDGARGRPVPRTGRPADALSRWILAFQGDSGYKAALAEWRRTKSRAWLYAALWRADSSAPDELIDTALAVGLDTPGGPALRYAAARLLASKGRFDEACEHTDQVLAALATFPSAQNRAAQLRVQLARDREEFVRLAPRKVIYAATELDTDEWQSQDQPDLRWIDHQLPQFREWIRRETIESAARAAKLMSLPRFDETAADIFNERLPLRSLRAVAASDGLPPHLRDELRVVTWTRAVLLNRFDIAGQLGPAVATLHPKLGPEMRRFLDQPSEETAAFVLLKLPGARPYVSRGYGRNVPLDEHDEWGRNWWYRFTEPEMHAIDLPYIGNITAVRL